MCRLQKWCNSDATNLDCTIETPKSPWLRDFHCITKGMLFLGMIVVPVSILVGMCAFVTVCCVRKEMLFHSVISKQGIILILNFQSQQLQLTLEKDSRLLWRKIWLWDRLLYLRGLELLTFQCYFCLHEFTQWVISARRKISHIECISYNESTHASFTKNYHSSQKYPNVWWPFVTYCHSWWGCAADCSYPEHRRSLALLLQAQTIVGAQQLGFASGGRTEDLRASVCKQHYPIPEKVWKFLPRCNLLESLLPRKIFLQKPDFC